MSVPLEVLPLWAGDFDGDTLSILYIINKAIEVAAEEVFSPRYSMHISRNDGMYNNDINHQKDIIIAACGLIGTCRKYYTDEELAIIHKAKSIKSTKETTVSVGDFSHDKKPSNLTGAAASINYIPQSEDIEIVKDFKVFLDRCRYSQTVYEKYGGIA